MAITLSQRPAVSVGATRWHDIDFTNELRGSETIASVATPTEQTTAHLTITGTAVNTSTLEVNGRTVAVGKAVSMKISGQTAGTTYTVLVTITTTGGEILPYYIVFVGV